MTATTRLGASCKTCGARLVSAPARGPGPSVRISRDRLLFETSRATGVPEHEIAGRCRRTSIAFARHVAIYVARTVGAQSYPEIGALFGIDHTSAMAACRKITALVESEEWARDVVRLVSAGVRRGQGDVGELLAAAQGAA